MKCSMRRWLGLKVIATLAGFLFCAAASSGVQAAAESVNWKLLDAAEEGRWEEVKQLVESGGSVHTEN